MDTNGTGTYLRSTATRRRIVLFPLPFQGHITPMLQLASILHAQGFKITIIHTEYNSPNYSNYPNFTFKIIKESFSEIKTHTPKDADSNFDLDYLNKSCADPFRDCVSGLLDDESIACIIADSVFNFTYTVADDLKIPIMVFWASSVAALLVFGQLTDFYEKGYFNPASEDPESHIPEYPLMKVKDMMKIATGPQALGDYVTNMLKQINASSGIIWNTFKELEQPSLETINQQCFQVPSFTYGPFHNHFSATSSSLIQQDRTILSWLDAQPPKSTIYISFGSAVCVTEPAFQQMARGLADIGLPFLWVVRPGMVPGSEWLESLPEKFLERVGDRGGIVKWCPQQEVLAHPTTGCFWTHGGWNSTLESISEWVPMICSPFTGDQLTNARHVSNDWKIGVYLEDGFEREGIEIAIKRVMFDKQGEEMRHRISCLKEKLNISLEEGGSSHGSLKSLVDYILSL